MSKNTKRPELGTEEHKEWMRKRAEKRSKEIFSASAADFEEECRVISGSVKTLTATDAELFPDELEEYTLEERKPHLVPPKKNNFIKIKSCD